MTSDSIPPTLHKATESDDSKRASPTPGSPGHAVRAARERARLTLEELAMQTKLARGTLDALERDDFDSLNEPVYIRGYYRKCAKVLVLQEAELIAAYEKLVVPKAPQAPTKLLIGGSPSMGRPRSRRRSGGSSGKVIAIVIAAAVVSAVAWALLNDPGVLGSLRGSSSTAAKPGPVTSTVPAADLAAAPEPSAAGPAVVESNLAAAAQPSTAPSSAAPETASTASGPASAPAATTAAVTSAPVTSSAATAAVTPSLGATESGALSLSFDSTSWVRVEDADGKLLLSGVIQAGDQQQLHGRAPYSLFIGNAPGVKVEYAGKIIDTAPFVKGNSTARLTVP